MRYGTGQPWTDCDEPVPGRYLTEAGLERLREEIEDLELRIEFLDGIEYGLLVCDEIARGVYTFLDFLAEEAETWSYMMPETEFARLKFYVEWIPCMGIVTLNKEQPRRVVSWNNGEMHYSIDRGAMERTASRRTNEGSSHPRLLRCGLRHRVGCGRQQGPALRDTEVGILAEDGAADN